VSEQSEKKRLSWPAVSAIASLGTLSIAVFYLFVFPRANLGWALLSQSSLLSDGPQNSHVAVLVDNHPSKDVQLVRLKLANIGNQTIHATDFDDEVSPGQKGLAFECSDKTAKMLSADIEAMNPQSRKPLPLIIANNQSSIVLPPFNFNPGESVTLRILLAPKVANVALVGHIAGVNIEDSSVGYHAFKRFMDYFGWVLTGLFFIFWSAASTRFSGKTPMQKSDIILVIVVNVLLVAIVIAFVLDFWLQMRMQLVL
jgi:hypothetical protein